MGIGRNFYYIVWLSECMHPSNLANIHSLRLFYDTENSEQLSSRNIYTPDPKGHFIGYVSTCRCYIDHFT